jgi:hypothetical protein
VDAERAVAKSQRSPQRGSADRDCPLGTMRGRRKPNMQDEARNPEQDEIERSAERGDQAQDEIEPRDAAQQDFASRNVIMSNALQGGASPAAGSVIGTGGELGMQPETDEALTDEEEELPAHETREERDAGH